MQFFHLARRLALCIALLAGPASTRLLAGTRVSPALAVSACDPPGIPAVPQSQSLALDAAAHVLIVATSTGLVLLDSCTGRMLGQPIRVDGTPSQVAVDSGAGIAVVLVAPRVRRFDIRRRRWLADVAQLPASVYPVQVAVVSRTHQLLVLDQSNATLWVADIRSGQVHHAVKKLPGLPTAVGVDADRHRAFVASEGSGVDNVVSTIDTTNWRVVQRTPAGRTPLALAVSSRMGLVFVANRDSKSLSVLSAASDTSLRTIPLPAAPQALAIDDQRGRIFVTTQESSAGQTGPLLALNLVTGHVQRMGLKGAVLAVDPQTGTLFYRDAATNRLVALPASHSSQPTATRTSTPGMTSTAIPTATHTPRPTATMTPRPPATRTPKPVATSTSIPTSTNTPSPTETVTATGTATVAPAPSPTPIPHLKVSVARLTFTPRDVRTTSAPEAVVLANDGRGQVMVAHITIQGHNAQDFTYNGTGCRPRTLSPGAACTVYVSFRPLAAGIRMATLVILDNGASPPHSVALIGVGVALQPRLAVTPATGVRFPARMVGTTSQPVALRLSSNGTAALVLRQMEILGQDRQDFALISSCTGASLAARKEGTPTATCVIRITFTPSAAGPRTAYLAIRDNSAAGLHRVTLFGMGNALTKILEITPVSLTFAPQVLHGASAAQLVTLHATGSSEVSINTIILLGENSDFMLDAAACSNRILNPGDRCTITVTFIPTVAGTRTGTIVILDDTPSHQHRVTLAGTGRSPPKALEVNPLTLTFAPQALHSTSPAQTITVRASGDTAVAINAISLLGASSDFTLDASACANRSLNPGTICGITVRFTPTVSGPRVATVIILDDTPDHQHRISLTGIGQR